MHKMEFNSHSVPSFLERNPICIESIESFQNVLWNGDAVAPQLRHAQSNKFLFLIIIVRPCLIETESPTIRTFERMHMASIADKLINFKILIGNDDQRSSEQRPTTGRCLFLMFIVLMMCSLPCFLQRSRYRNCLCDSLQLVPQQLMRCKHRQVNR